MNGVLSPHVSIGVMFNNASIGHLFNNYAVVLPTLSWKILGNSFSCSIALAIFIIV